MCYIRIACNPLKNQFAMWTGLKSSHILTQTKYCFFGVFFTINMEQIVVMINMPNMCFCSITFQVSRK